MTLLAGLNVLQVGPGVAAAVCGRAFADLDAHVRCLAADNASPFAAYLNDAKEDCGSRIGAENLRSFAADAALIICEGGPAALRTRGIDLAEIRVLNPDAVIVAISPFGQTGPRANEPATDLTLLCASGIVRMLTGQVNDTSEPPTQSVGQQSAFIGGLAAACGGMHAVLSADRDGIIDISIQEALATLAITELTRASLHGRVWSRKRVADGNGATVTILPAKDGYVAISPREVHQWKSWLTVMGSPAWGEEARFATKADRVENWDALHGLMSDWSRSRAKQETADVAQAAHVPSFPLRELGEQLDSSQLDHRSFYRSLAWQGETLKVPGMAYGLSLFGGNLPSDRVPVPGELPLSGVRVLDFSWVIAGPTTTRYLAAMGAEVIKVEAPGRGDPGRASELHTVLGQAKRAITLNLKDPEAVNIARSLAARSDILIENFGMGVMERFGLGAEALRKENPCLLYISASGMGRTGPEANAVAYGTLLQCYAGFAGLNRQPDMPPRVGMAWLDPMCGLKLAFAAAAGIWNRRRTGGGARIDFSMIEAMLWTMAEPLIAAQQSPPLQPCGNASDRFVPHGIYPSMEGDFWIGIAVTTEDEWRALCEIVPGLSEWRNAGLKARQSSRQKIDLVLAEWSKTQDTSSAAKVLTNAGVPSASVASMLDLVNSDHLLARQFWETSDDGSLPGLPWRSSFGRKQGTAPALGADIDAVLQEVLGMAPGEIASLRGAGTFG